MPDTTVDASTHSTLYFRALCLGPVWTDESTAYVFYISAPGNAIVYRKTTNGGTSWGSEVTVRAGSIMKTSIWYDRWTPGDTGTTIHIAYMDSGTDDVYYRDLDTSDDTLGTERTLFDGAFFASGDWGNSVVDVVKARGGNLYIGFWGGSGQSGFHRSVDSGVNWTSRADVADGATPEAIILMPGDEADNQDIWCIYWDRSTDEISLKIYDDSDGASGSWSETLISTDMNFPASNDYIQMSAAPRHTDNHVILAAWTDIDLSTADLKVWDIGGSADITAKTDVVTDLDESAQVAVFINQQNDDIYVAYIKGGTWESTTDIKYKKSDDGAGTWGAEQDYSEAAADDLRALWAGISVGDAGGKFQPCWFNDDLNDLFVNLVNDVDIAAVVTDAFEAARQMGSLQPYIEPLEIVAY